MVNLEREKTIRQKPKGVNTMKKSIKNTIMIGMAAVLIGTSAVTLSYAQGNRGTQMMPPQMQSQQSDGRQNHDQFDNFGQSSDNQNSNSFRQRQMPNNQQDDSSSQKPQMPNSQQGNSNSSQQQAPNAQDGSSTDSKSQQSSDSDSSDNSSSKSDSSSATNTALSIEALAADDDENQSTAQQGLPSNGFNRRNIGAISALCYMFAALQIAIILAMIAYLVISKFNAVSFNEVLANMRKKQ